MRQLELNIGCKVKIRGKGSLRDRKRVSSMIKFFKLLVEKVMKFDVLEITDVTDLTIGH